MNIRKTIEELYKSIDNLCEICNVFAKVVSSPKLEENNTRWVFEIEDFSKRKIWVAIHGVIPNSLHLPYHETDVNLLQIFKDDSLRDLIEPGVSILVQGVPRKSNSSRPLWINVQTILILQPNLCYGRRQLNIGYLKCDREIYLNLEKGITNIQNIPNDTNFIYSVIGNTIHSLFSRMAVERKIEVTKHLTTHQLINTLLIGLTLSDNSWMKVVNAAESFVEIVKQSPTLSNIINQDNWEIESSVLNNGVKVAPDLIRPKEILELKNYTYNSIQKNELIIKSQIESYFLWAMVEFGQNEVINNNWMARVVFLHSSVPEDQRLMTINPNGSLLGKFILNRHRLLSIRNGHTLYKPEKKNCKSSCIYYPSSNGDNICSNACTFYCQTERYWKCEQCHLKELCHFRNNLYDFNNLDKFNKLRIALRNEEEERNELQIITENLSSNDLVGFELSGFKYIIHYDSILELKIPTKFLNYYFAKLGDCFELISESFIVGTVCCLNIKRDVLFLRIDDIVDSTRLRGQVMSLRFLPGNTLECRRMLQYLDILQRLNNDTEEKDISERNVDKIYALPNFSFFPDLLLINVWGKQQQFSALKDIISKIENEITGKILIIGDCELIKDRLFFNDLFEISCFSDDLNANNFDYKDLILDKINSFSKSKFWYSNFEFIYSENMAWLKSHFSFEAIIILDAEKCQPILLEKVSFYVSKIICIGLEYGNGMRAENTITQETILFQNCFSLMQNNITYFVPKRIKSIKKYSYEANLLIENYHKLNISSNSNSVVTYPIEFWGVKNKETSIKFNQEHYYLSKAIHSSDPNKSCEFEFKFLAFDKLTLSGLRQILKGVDAEKLEKLDLMKDNNKLNTSILGYPAFLNIKRRNFEENHIIKLKIPLCFIDYIQRFVNISQDEVNAICEWLNNNDNNNVIVTSPFNSQCTLLAQGLNSKGIKVKTVPLDLLGSIDQNNKPILLMSWGYNKEGTLLPYPLNDYKNFIEVICGNWSKVLIFASEYARSHHPMLNALFD